MQNNSYVRARIDDETKDLAAAALSKMGLSVSDAIRLLMMRIAEEKRMPFEVRVPNAATRAAMAEAEAGQVHRVADTDQLMEALNAPD